MKKPNYPWNKGKKGVYSKITLDLMRIKKPNALKKCSICYVMFFGYGRSEFCEKCNFLECEWCKNKFKRHRKGLLKKSRFCSNDCSNNFNRKDFYLNNSPISCLQCNKIYYKNNNYLKIRESKFCSNKCRFDWVSKNKKGKNSPFWKGGKSSIYKRLRNSRKFKVWRKAVFERDDYTCQHCHVKGGYLEPHHIKSFTYFPKERFNVNNGMTLCRKCHLKTDNFGTKARILHEIKK
jgi:hypothetical protein